MSIRSSIREMLAALVIWWTRKVEGAEAKIKEMVGLGMEVAKANNKCPTGICSLNILSKTMVLKREKHLKVEIKVMVFWIWGNIIRFFFCILMY